MNCNPNDIIGKKFGMLTVVKEVEKRKEPSGKIVRQYECLCDCGNIKIAQRNNLINNKILNCGHHKDIIKSKRILTYRKQFAEEKHSGWKVLEFDHQEKGEEYYKCQCDCGCEEFKIISRNKINKTLCKKRKLEEKEKLKKERENFSIYEVPKTVEDLTGKVFGRLTVLGFAGIYSNYTYWVCQCQCGNKVLRRAYELKKNQNASCGCYNIEKSKEKALDLVGQKIGRLTVLKRVENRDGQSAFLCKCECGNEIVVKGTRLNKGKSLSCGCVKSRGEFQIAKFLNENNIKYNSQKKFDECKNKDFLRFDFQIFYKDRDDFFLCEFQGRQHYLPDSQFAKTKQEAEEKYEYITTNDNTKRKFCQDNNIKLIEIPYWDFDKIEYILEKELNL